MTEKIAKRIEEIAIELTNELSVVETPGELDSVNKIFEIFSKMPYYTENPEDLFFVETGDKLGRKSVVAVLRGEKEQQQKNGCNDRTYRYCGNLGLWQSSGICKQTI